MQRLLLIHPNYLLLLNRISLLFEQGGDVVTRTALKRINWNSYKINQTQDKIGVFVSIVSTKIPFKGTGKEYIGDDISEIATAVKSAIQQCCIQLKSKIVKKMQAREQKERKRSLSRRLRDGISVCYIVELVKNPEKIFIFNTNPNHSNFIDLHSPTFVFRLMSQSIHPVSAATTQLSRLLAKRREKI